MGFKPTLSFGFALILSGCTQGAKISIQSDPAALTVSVESKGWFSGADNLCIYTVSAMRGSRKSQPPVSIGTYYVPKTQGANPCQSTVSVPRSALFNTAKLEPDLEYEISVSGIGFMDFETVKGRDLL